MVFSKNIRCAKTTCPAILNCVISRNCQMTMRTLMSCIANTRRIVLQSCSLVHNTTSSGHFGRAIRRPFFESKITPFSGVIKSPNFFKHGSNFGTVLVCWNYNVQQGTVMIAYRKIRRHSSRHTWTPRGTISCSHLRESWGWHSPLLKIGNDLTIGL